MPKMPSAPLTDGSITSQRQEGPAWPSLISAIAIMGKSENHDQPVIKQTHVHEEGQLVYASAEVVAVGEVDGYWVVPPTRAVWLPPGVSHWARSSANVRLRTVLVANGNNLGMPEKSCVVLVPPVMREIIIALTEKPVHQPQSEIDVAMMRLLALHITENPILPLHLPALRDRRLVLIEQHVLSKPHERIPLPNGPVG